MRESAELQEGARTRALPGGRPNPPFEGLASETRQTLALPGRFGPQALLEIAVDNDGNHALRGGHIEVHNL